MKKFLMRVVLFFLTVFCIFVALNQGYIYASALKEGKPTDKFSNIPSNLKFLNVGPSHGQLGFVWSEETIGSNNGFNFALGSQDYVNDLTIIHKFIDKIDSGAVLFIPVSFVSLYVNQPLWPTFEAVNMQYYDFLNYNEIVNVDFKTYMTRKVFPLLSAEDKVFDVFLPAKQNETEIVSKMRASELEDLEETAHNRYLFHYDTMIQANGYGGKVAPQGKASLIKLIDLCKENEITPILITLPVTSNYKNQFGEKFFSDLAHEINLITQQENVEYFDYSQDARICGDLQNFCDSDHLSDVGAILFTKLLVQDLHLC